MQGLAGVPNVVCKNARDAKCKLYHEGALSAGSNDPRSRQLHACAVEAELTLAGAWTAADKRSFFALLQRGFTPRRWTV